MKHRLARPTIKKIGGGIALACSLASLALTCAMPVKADPALKSNSALQDLLQELNYRHANLTKRLKEAIEAKRIDPEPAQQFLDRSFWHRWLLLVAWSDWHVCS